MDKIYGKQFRLQIKKEWHNPQIKKKHIYMDIDKPLRLAFSFELI